jgi:hypothetical protein
MSSYLDEPDEDIQDEGKQDAVITLSEEEKEIIKAQCTVLKEEGNEFFKNQDYDGALEKYSVRYYFPRIK